MEEKNYEVNKKYDEKILINVLKNFDKSGEYVVEPGRNEIKKFEIDIKNNLEKQNNKSENLETKKMINIKKFKLSKYNEEKSYIVPLNGAPTLEFSNHHPVSCIVLTL